MDDKKGPRRDPVGVSIEGLEITVKRKSSLLGPFAAPNNRPLKTLISSLCAKVEGSSLFAILGGSGEIFAIFLDLYLVFISYYTNCC